MGQGTQAHISPVIGDRSAELTIAVQNVDTNMGVHAYKYYSSSFENIVKSELSSCEKLWTSV